MEAGFAAAFAIGLLGGVHCVGMCGGIVGALTVQTPRRQRAWRLHLAYNAGRIASYAAAGAVMGMIGGASLIFNQILPMQLLLYVLANLLLAGLAFKRLRDFTSNRRLRLAAGVLVAGFGVVGLARLANLGEHIRQGLLCII